MSNFCFITKDSRKIDVLYYMTGGLCSQDGDHGDDDDDDDEPREAGVEGRVEKYIGVKVKACILLMKHLFSLQRTIFMNFLLHSFCDLMYRTKFEI